MKFVVTIKLGGEAKEVPEIQWPPQEVEAEDRWDALVKVVEGLGLEKEIPMRYFWKKASIVKRERKDVRRFRVKDALVGRVEEEGPLGKPEELEDPGV